MISSVTREDFYPWNDWTDQKFNIPRTHSDKWFQFVKYKADSFIKDCSTERVYTSESKIWIWLKCAGIALATPVTHGVLSLVDSVCRIVTLVTFSHFWLPLICAPKTFIIHHHKKENGENGVKINPFAGIQLDEVPEAFLSSYHFKARLAWAGQDYLNFCVPFFL